MVVCAAPSGDGGPHPGAQPSGASTGRDDDAIDAEFEVKKYAGRQKDRSPLPLGEG